MEKKLAELDKLRLIPMDIGGRMRLQSAIGEAAGQADARTGYLFPYGRGSA
jgi:hypothetical protein